MVIYLSDTSQMTAVFIDANMRTSKLTHLARFVHIWLLVSKRGQTIIGRRINPHNMLFLRMP